MTGHTSLEEVTELDIEVDTTDQSLAALGDKLPNLVRLRLSNSVLSSVRDLGTSLRGLRVLWLARCGITDLDGIGALQSLQELYLAFNDISDLSPLAIHEQLEVLDLDSNLVSDVLQVDQLGTCQRLHTLTLDANPLCRIPEYRRVVLHHVPQLHVLDDMDVEEDDRKRVRATRRSWPCPSRARGCAHRALMVARFVQPCPAALQAAAELARKASSRSATDVAAATAARRTPLSPAPAVTPRRPRADSAASEHGSCDSPLDEHSERLMVAEGIKRARVEEEERLLEVHSPVMHTSDGEAPAAPLLLLYVTLPRAARSACSLPAAPVAARRPEGVRCLLGAVARPPAPRPRRWAPLRLLPALLRGWAARGAGLPPRGQARRVVFVRGVRRWCVAAPAPAPHLCCAGAHATPCAQPAAREASPEGQGGASALTHGSEVLFVGPNPVVAMRRRRTEAMEESVRARRPARTRSARLRSHLTDAPPRCSPARWAGR